MSKYARYNSPLDLGVTFCEDGNDEYWYPDDPDRNVIFRCPRTPPEGYKMTQEEYLAVPGSTNSSCKQQALVRRYHQADSNRGD